MVEVTIILILPRAGTGVTIQTQRSYFVTCNGCLRSPGLAELWLTGLDCDTDETEA